MIESMSQGLNKLNIFCPISKVKIVYYYFIMLIYFALFVPHLYGFHRAHRIAETGVHSSYSRNILATVFIKYPKPIQSNVNAFGESRLILYARAKKNSPEDGQPKPKEPPKRKKKSDSPANAASADQSGKSPDNTDDDWSSIERNLKQMLGGLEDDADFDLINDNWDSLPEFDSKNQKSKAKKRNKDATGSDSSSDIDPLQLDLDLDLNMGLNDALLTDIELDNALRSIESGDFELDDFLIPEDGSELEMFDALEELDNDLLDDSITPLSNVKNKKDKGKIATAELALEQEGDDVDEDENESDEESMDDDEILSRNEDNDLMLDVLGSDDDSYNIDDIDEEFTSSKKTQRTSSKSRKPTVQASINTSKKRVANPFKASDSISIDDDSGLSESQLLEALLSETDGSNAIDLSLLDAASLGASPTASAAADNEGPLVIDGIQLNRDEFDLGVDPPPLEEFKRLMESLGPETMFDDEGLFDEAAAKAGMSLDYDMGESDDAESVEEDILPELTDEEKLWYPSVYEGGSPSRFGSNMSSTVSADLEGWLTEHDDPAEWRVQIVSVVTNSTRNSTAVEMVEKVYDHIRNGTENDPRITYQTICLERSDGEPFEELDDMIQMWLESYNTYHLVDGAAMKEAWGAIMPHIMLSEKNLKAIIDQVKWALKEDSLDGALLSPRFRKVRFRGGAKEMAFGFNTEHLDSEFSVVSVR